VSRHGQDQGDPYGYSWSYGSMDDEEILGERRPEGDASDKGAPDGGVDRGGPFGQTASGGCLVALTWTGVLAGTLAALAGRIGF
jgi:hypothetical protein